jgi:hypothetical protein
MRFSVSCHQSERERARIIRFNSFNNSCFLLPIVETHFILKEEKTGKPRARLATRRRFVSSVAHRRGVKTDGPEDDAHRLSVTGEIAARRRRRGGGGGEPESFHFETDD